MFLEQSAEKQLSRTWKTKTCTELYMYLCCKQTEVKRHQVPSLSSGFHGLEHRCLRSPSRTHSLTLLTNIRAGIKMLSIIKENFDAAAESSHLERGFSFSAGPSQLFRSPWLLINWCCVWWCTKPLLHVTCKRCWNKATYIINMSAFRHWGFLLDGAQTCRLNTMKCFN